MQCIGMSRQISYHCDLPVIPSSPCSLWTGSAFSAGVRVFLGVFRGVAFIGVVCRGVVLRGVKRGGNPESLADLRTGVAGLRGVDMVLATKDSSLQISQQREQGLTQQITTLEDPVRTRWCWMPSGSLPTMLLSCCPCSVGFCYDGFFFFRFHAKSSLKIAVK